jgi:hypothetical protein
LENIYRFRWIIFSIFLRSFIRFGYWPSILFELRVSDCDSGDNKFVIFRDFGDFLFEFCLGFFWDGRPESKKNSLKRVLENNICFYNFDGYFGEIYSGRDNGIVVRVVDELFNGVLFYGLAVRFFFGKVALFFNSKKWILPGFAYNVFFDFFRESNFWIIRLYNRGRIFFTFIGKRSFIYKAGSDNILEKSVKNFIGYTDWDNKKQWGRFREHSQ